MRDGRPGHSERSADGTSPSDRMNRILRRGVPLVCRRTPLPDPGGAPFPCARPRSGAASTFAGPPHMRGD